MILIITGATHTGKTKTAQMLMEKTGYPYLSIDHLKMGLMRSGNTNLMPDSPDSQLTDYLWPIVREIIKTAIENNQNLIVEGCYIPFDWKSGFSGKYLASIRFLCLVMSEMYIKENFCAIQDYANIIEKRVDDAFYTLDTLVQDNLKILKSCKANSLNYLLIDNEYPQEINMEYFKSGCENII